VIRKLIGDTLEALRFAVVASKTDRVTAAHIRQLYARRKNA
jgi:hypothetical protein